MWPHKNKRLLHVKNRMDICQLNVEHWTNFILKKGFEQVTNIILLCQNNYIYMYLSMIISLTLLLSCALLLQVRDSLSSLS